MTTLTLLSTGLIAVTMLGVPAMAHTHHPIKHRSVMRTAPVGPETLVYQGGRTCIPAPRVGAFATSPWTGNNVPCEPGTGSF